ERDLDPESATTFPATLAELTERLKHWKNILQSNVEDRFPAVLKLEEESKTLRDFHVVDIELPGQYFTDQVCRIITFYCPYQSQYITHSCYITKMDAFPT